MQEFYKQFSKSEEFTAEDYEDQIKILSMENNQLKRENIFLRKKLERNKPFKNQQSLKRTPRASKQGDITVEHITDEKQNHIYNLVEQISVLKQSLRILNVDQKILKPIRTINYEEIKNFDSDLKLKENLEQITTLPIQERYLQLLQSLDQYLIAKASEQSNMFEIIEQITDSLRKINSVFTHKVTTIKKSYVKFSSKFKIFKLQFEQYRENIFHALKSMNKTFQKSKFQNELSKVSPSPSFNNQVESDLKDKEILELKKKIIKLEVQLKMINNNNKIIN